MNDIRTPGGVYISVDKLGDEQVRLNVMSPTNVTHVVLSEDNIDDLIEQLSAHTPPSNSMEVVKKVVKDAIAEDRQEELTRMREYNLAVLKRLGL